MEKNRIIDIVNSDGTSESVNLITYLLSDDGIRQYIVYSKDESYGLDDDQIIYISKIQMQDNVLVIDEIEDDVEWNEVQKLLRRIANAK